MLPGDGAQALLVDGGGVDGGQGMMLCNHAADVHALGSFAPLAAGTVGVLAIRPDGTRIVLQVMADPLAQRKPDS